MSTVTTASVCYVPSKAGTTILLTCKKRKRSSSIFDTNPNRNVDLEIAATSSRHSSDEDTLVEGDPNEHIESGVRDGKFANYWITTTVISTVTTFRFDC